MAPSVTAEELNQKEIANVWEKSQSKFETKRSSEFYDPCQEAANRSIKCMNRNNGDKDMCQDYFHFGDSKGYELTGANTEHIETARKHGFKNAGKKSSGMEVDGLVEANARNESKTRSD